jgi:hypothetical protein
VNNFFFSRPQQADGPRQRQFAGHYGKKRPVFLKQPGRSPAKAVCRTLWKKATGIFETTRSLFC